MFKSFWPDVAKVEDGKLYLSTVTRRGLKLMSWDKDGKRGVLFYAKLYGYYLYGAFCITGCFGSLFYYTGKYGYDFGRFSDGMVGILMYLWMLMATTIFSGKQKEFETLLDELGDFSDFGVPDGIEILNNRVDKMSTVVATWMWVSVALAGIYNLFVPCEDFVEDKCGMIIYYYFPVKNFFTRPWRRFSVFVQCTAVMFGSTPVFFGPWVMLNISEYLVNRMDHLIRLLRVIPTLNTRLARHRQLSKCVKYHTQILEMADRLSEYTYVFLLIHVPYTTFMITLICIQLLVQITYLNMADLFIWFFYIALCCVFGERLFAKSYEIGEEFYYNIPFDGDIKTQKEMLFMIQANRLIGISAGMNEYCNHEKLVEILKTSYSFITLIASTDEEF